jgi:hypothetical protein
MQAPLEILYAGVVIGRAQGVRSAEGEAAFFLPGKEPMPVGTVLRLRSQKSETLARVVRAVESPDPAVCGMQVRLIGTEEEVSPDWIPAPASASAKPKAPMPMPVTMPSEEPTPNVTVDVSLVTPEVKPAYEALAADSAAIPEAVPVSVGSSLTGALARAAKVSTDTEATTEAVAETAASPEKVAPSAGAVDMDIPTTNTQAAVVEPFAPVATPVEASAPSPAAAADDSQSETGQAAASEDSEGGGEETGSGEIAPTTEEMPTARPIAGPSARRKTKRRRYQRA